MTITPQEHTKDMKDRFIIYCASVMGLEVVPDSMFHIVRTKAPHGVRVLIPDYWDDLNVMAEVVEKLLDTHVPNRPFSGAIRRNGIKQTFRDFIWSTKC